MNDVMMKGLLKVVKNFISPDQVKGIAHDFLNQAIEYKNKIVLNADDNEATVSAIIYEVHGKVYFAIAFFTPENKITRFENVRLLDDLIDNVIKSI